MSGVTRVEVDDTDDFAAWFALFDRAQRLAAGDDEGWLAEEWRARAGDEGVPVHDRLYRLGPRGAPLAVAHAAFNALDNRHLADAGLFVDPAHRRGGLGTELLAGLSDVVRARGVTTLVVRVLVAPGSAADAAARGFARARGLRHTTTAVRRAWTLPGGPELEALATRWAARAAGYDVVVYRGPTPEDLLSERARLAALIGSAVPDPGVGTEPERWDGARVRALEARVEQMGRLFDVALARETASGRLVGFSELTVSRERPHSAYQWGTFVETAHRRRGIAAWLKVEAARALVAASPATTRILTENDARNAPVVAMNESLGFRVTGENLSFAVDL